MKMLLLRAAIGCVAACGTAAPLHAQDAPHATHGPRLGGAFAAAASDTLHVEAVWSEQRRLRVFVVDASGTPIALERLRGFTGSVLAGGSESPLVLFEADGYFEARIPTLPIPATMVVRLVQPAPASTDDRLPIAFDGYSPNPTGITSIPAEIPGTLAGITGAIARERRGVTAAIAEGNFAILSGAEERLRELVLAIEPFLASTPEDVRTEARAATTAVVRACWLLHTVLDYGTVPQRDEALRRLHEALDRTAAVVSRATR